MMTDIFIPPVLTPSKAHQSHKGDNLLHLIPAKINERECEDFQEPFGEKATHEGDGVKCSDLL
jgi:hypothetical protein